MLKDKIIVYHVAIPYKDDFILPVGITLAEAKSFMAIYFDNEPYKTLYANLYEKQYTLAI